MAVLCPAAWDKNCTPYRPTPGSSCGQKKSEKFSSSKKKSTSMAPDCLLSYSFSVCKSTQKEVVFLQTLPDLKKGQSRRPCLKLLHGMNHWWKSTSLVNILHPLWIRTPVGQHTNASYELSLLKRMKKGGSKNVCVFCFFSNFGTLMFVWGIFFFEKSSTT